MNDQYIDALPQDWIQHCVSEHVQVREHRFDFEREFGAFVNEGIIVQASMRNMMNQVDRYQVDFSTLKSVLSSEQVVSNPANFERILANMELPLQRLFELFDSCTDVDAKL